MIKNRLHEILIERQMSQDDLAKLAGISNNTMSKIYNMRKPIKSTMMLQICIALNLPLGEVFYIDKSDFEKKTLTTPQTLKAS